MEVDLTHDDDDDNIRFYECPEDGVSMFDVLHLAMFPKLRNQIEKILFLDALNPKGNLFVYTRTPVTVDNINNNQVDGLMVVEPFPTTTTTIPTTTTTTPMTTTNAYVITHLSGELDAIFKVVIATYSKEKFWIRLQESQWHPTLFTHLIDYGFAKPVMLDRHYIYMKYISRVAKHQLVRLLDQLVVATRTNKAVLKTLFPPTLAALLASYSHKEFEVSGRIAIKSYDEANVATLAFDKFSALEGSKCSVEDNYLVYVPAKGPIIFHTHPNVCYGAFRFFLAWPSGQDMVVNPQFYLENNDILVQFVSSAEGLWTMHMSYEFQKILYYLKTNKLTTCSLHLLEAIKTKFEKVEQSRLKSHVDSQERPLMKQRYLEMVNAYTISHLLQDVPTLATACTVDMLADKDSVLYNINLIPWTTFTEHGALRMDFEYLPDPEGNLPAYIPPDSLVQCGATTTTTTTYGR